MMMTTAMADFLGRVEHTETFEPVTVTVKVEGFVDLETIVDGYTLSIEENGDLRLGGYGNEMYITLDDCVIEHETEQEGIVIDDYYLKRDNITVIISFDVSNY